jgi:hypothetical protein
MPDDPLFAQPGPVPDLDPDVLIWPLHVCLLGDEPPYRPCICCGALVDLVDYLDPCPNAELPL